MNFQLQMALSPILAKMAREKLCYTRHSRVSMYVIASYRQHTRVDDGWEG